MEYAALGIATLAFFFALLALARSASKGTATGEDPAQDVRRRIEALKSELANELDVQRKLLARVAAGEALGAEMILEGRLWQDVDAVRAAEMLAAGDLHVIDVRTAQETAHGVLPGAKLIPVDQLEQRLREIPKDKRRKLVYCAAGARSAAACEFLAAQGFEQVYNLAGGFSGWSGPRERPR